MTKEWVMEQKKKAAQEVEKTCDQSIDYVKSADFLTDEEKEIFINELQSGADACAEMAMLKVGVSISERSNGKSGALLSKLHEWNKKSPFPEYKAALQIIEYIDFDKYLDSEPVMFNGDIIITDPCYIIKKHDPEVEANRPKWNDFHTYSSESEYPDYDGTGSKTYTEEHNKFYQALTEYDNEHEDDWIRSNYGLDMDVLGIHTYITKPTICGDWSCRTFNPYTGEDYGEFCADTGRVSVFLLDEVLKYNPKFNYHSDREWTTTWIKNFSGYVQIVVEEEKYPDDELSEYIVKVVGNGHNTSTGEPITFITEQAGF